MPKFRWNEKKVKKLISNGGDVSFLLKKYDIKQDTTTPDINTLQDRWSDTALRWTLENRDSELFQELLSVPGLKLPENIIDDVVRIQVAKFEDDARDNYITSILPLVISAGANINYREEDSHFGWTPLVDCIYSELYSKAAIPILVNNGVDINIKCKQGRTPLIHCIRAGDIDTFNLLFSTNKININAKCYGGYTPLMYAIVYQISDAFNTLLNAGAKINSIDSEENTALHFAAMDANIDFCVKLILRGADPYALNEAANDPIDVYGTRIANINKEAIDKGIQQMLDAYEVYMQRVRDENWAARWPLMNSLTGSRIILMARHVAADAAIQATLDKSIKLPSISRNTPQENRAYLHDQIFKNPGILRNIVSYLGREPDETKDTDNNYQDDLDEEKGHCWDDILEGYYL